MKRAILLLLIGVAIGGGAVWLKTRSHSVPENDSPAAEKSAGEAAAHTSIKHDADGNVVVGLSDELKASAGIVATNPAPAQWVPEVMGFGRVADPMALAAFATELASARAAGVASSNEFARLKTLEGQGNASARALQSAEAAAQRDQLAIQSAADRLALSWGRAVANRDDLPAFIRSLTTLEAALVRIDLPAGEILETPPTGARVVALSGDSSDAEFLGAAAGVDPQSQGRGFIFFLPTNSLRLAGGEAVTGFLRIPGEPQAGVMVPRDAVVRTQGKGWVYVPSETGAAFTRKEIALDHPMENGWFVARGLKAGDRVVVIGAQMLLSEELKASFSGD